MQIYLLHHRNFSNWFSKLQSHCTDRLVAALSLHTMIVIFIEIKPDVITHHASIFLCSMDGHTADSSSVTTEFYWTDCALLLNDSNTVVSISAGVIVLMSSYTFEIIVGLPLNIWLICHILKKRLLFPTF